MNPPTVYLINRGLSEERIEKLLLKLSLTPLEAVVITRPHDAEYALKFHEGVTPLHRPIAIIGDFSEDCLALGDDTKVLQKKDSND